MGQPSLPRVLTLRDVVLFNITAIVGLRHLQTASQFGPASIVLWLIALLVFFLPSAAAVRELAEYFGKEACLVFSTGYQANLGLISGLVGRGDVVFLDKLDHASIVDGAKMSHGETIRFNHGDLAGLERKLQRIPEGTGTMVIVDGVYSMEGDIADIPGLLKISQKYGAALAIDDAHSVGVLGPKGDGTAAHYNLVDEVDIIVGTFSKSLASIGGFAAGTENVIHYLKHHSRPLIFTAALPPANTSGRGGGCTG